MNAIGIPPAALEDPNAVEMARVWVAQQGLHCVLNMGIYRGSEYREATAWGVILADLARHAADALVRSGDEPGGAAALEEIRRTFAAEIGEPTSEAEGAFKQTKQ